MVKITCFFDPLRCDSSVYSFLEYLSMEVTMKKWLSIIALSLMASTAFADISADSSAGIKITSYTYINQERKVAELCGVVLSPSTPATNVQVIVDYNTKRPATYNTLAGPDGRFCTVVITYYGTAIAKLF